MCLALFCYKATRRRRGKRFQPIIPIRLRFKSPQLENQEQLSSLFLSPYSDTEPTFSRALNKRMRATVQRPPLHWNRTWRQAGCVATWETGVEVIFTRCWNNKLSMRFCCSKSNTRVRSFTHSSFKSCKRGQTGCESVHLWGLKAWRRWVGSFLVISDPHSEVQNTANMLLIAIYHMFSVKDLIVSHFRWH